jgi:hypothetical protein
MFVPVPEIFLPMPNTHPHKWNIHPVLFHQVRAIATVFLGVPIVIVAAVPIVIAPFTMMVISHHRYWRNHGGSHQQPAQS